MGGNFSSLLIVSWQEFCFVLINEKISATSIFVYRILYGIGVLCANPSAFLSSRGLYYIHRG